MSITIIYSKEETDHSFSFTKNRILVSFLLFVTLLIGCAWFIQSYYQSQLNQFKLSATNNRDVSKDQYLALIEAQSNEKIGVLADKIANVEAQINRLNALGERVIDKSNLPKKEFDFDTSLPIGGPNIDPVGQSSQFVPLLEYIENIELHLENQQKQLVRLEIALNNLNLTKQLYISGRPVKGKGSWISSPFGTRKDPFTGRMTRHKGVDIAGYSGMPIIATAAGVVTDSGKKSGYGFMVEIQHGNGLVTRYAHAKKLKVNIGDVVKKGDIIAVMGSTGRSTGPHVHYEVLRNGMRINPNYYIQRTTG